MITTTHSVPVYCFGEVLWDILPGGPLPGGAPFNAAYHLSRLGVPTGMISRIGRDADGEQLEELMDTWGIGKDLLQTDPGQATSRVVARMNAENEMSYQILFPVAWDFIEATQAAIEKVKQAPYFIYGSLAARHTISRQALFQLLDHAPFKVFDINLRPPFFERELLEALLCRADLLKVNKAELEIIQQLFGAAPGKAPAGGSGETPGTSQESEPAQIALIREKFGIGEIIVTKGAGGASYYTAGGSYHARGIPVKVCDTVGSGDSFLAAFIAHHMRRQAPEAILKKAVAMGSFIAGRNGGCPSYQLSEYQEFIEICKF